jgi:2-aminoethylphosphonate-pyruvate transaminase
MARADSRATAARWSSERAIVLWLTFDDVPLDGARRDGAIVRALPAGADVFSVFAAMRETGVADVRRVGVLGTTEEQIRLGAAAGVGATVGVAEDEGRRCDLSAAEADFVVFPEQVDDLDETTFGTHRRLRPYVLLNPGPALTSETVKRAAIRSDLCHREPEYAAVEQRVREGLRQAAGVGEDWGVALLAGGGTAAVELVVARCVRPGHRLLVVENGAYGERVRRMAERHAINHVVVGAPWTAPVAADAVASAIDDDVDAIAVIHHETTSGLLNPIAEIAAVAKERDVRLVVDAVSSFGVEDIVLEDSGIDFLACSSNKCLHGLPGAAFVLVSPAGATRVAEVPAPSLYLDLAAYLAVETSGSVPFTPAIPAILALDAALRDFAVQGGSRERGRRYTERTGVLDRGFAELGLTQLIEPAARSRSVRSVRLPEGWTFAGLHAELKERGYVIYAGQGVLAHEIFRVCCLGELEPTALEGLVGELSTILSGVPAAA